MGTKSPFEVSAIESLCQDRAPRDIICELEQQVRVLQSDRAWWNWWYSHWGKWLQNTVVRLSDAIVTFTDAWLAPIASRPNRDAAIDQVM